MSAKHVDLVLSGALLAMGIAFFLVRYNWAVLAVFALAAAIFAWRAFAGFRRERRGDRVNGGKL